MNDRFIRACRREPVDCTPVWFMRQAGRYMAEYRTLRAKHAILEMCKTPELAAQVTLQPIERFPLDAAIIFADILLPLEPMGISLEFAEGEGPVIHNPVRDRAAVERLKVVDGDELEYVAEAIRHARRALNGRVPLIGFAGAPFTLASYAIEGGGSRNYLHTKQMMYGDPTAWHKLMDSPCCLRTIAADTGQCIRPRFPLSFAMCIMGSRYLAESSRRRAGDSVSAALPLLHHVWRRESIQLIGTTAHCTIRSAALTLTWRYSNVRRACTSAQ